MPLFHLQMLFMFSLFFTVMAGRHKTPRNLVENGSFEVFEPDKGTYHVNNHTDDHIILYYVGEQSRSIQGWVIAKGDVNWGRGRWHSCSDSSPSAVDLNGYVPGTIAATVDLIHGFHVYTVLVDAGAHADMGYAKVMASLSFAVQCTSSSHVLNSSTMLINRTVGFDRGNLSFINWRTYILIFDTSNETLCESVNLTFSSLSLGKYGPIIDNVRVYPGLHLPSSSEGLARAVRMQSTLMTAVVAFAVILVVIVVVYLKFFKARNKMHGIGRKLHHMLSVYSSTVLKVATNDFDPSCKIGQGGFGQVFKGVLSDGSVVAVKQLTPSSTYFCEENAAEFVNEINIISRVRHKNLVTLKGFASKGKEKLLVFEYMPNGSLDKVLFDKNSSRRNMEWTTRMKIIRGIANGIAYLHHGSELRIIHRDIKASNILLDEDFNAKVADFGIAKIVGDDQVLINTLTVAGTMGYLAPEYALRGQLTEKADVFSFGILVLEIVSGRTNTDLRLCVEEQYIVDWAWHLHDQGRVMELVDPRMEDEYDEEEAERAIMVALVCTRTDINDRPSMASALSMLSPLPSASGDLSPQLLRNSSHFQSKDAL